MLIPERIQTYLRKCKDKTPVYIYDVKYLTDRAKTAMGMALPFGFTARYAVKANPHPGIIKLFNENGLHFDASSEFEVKHLMDLGIPGPHISLSSQQPAIDYAALDLSGVKLVATSLHQLEQILQSTSSSPIAIRINPNNGYGGNKKVTTGGKTSSFGIWHEYIDDALALCRKVNRTVERVHIHVGSGFDVKVWGDVMDSALAVVDKLPDVTCLDIGGGYKVSRVPEEHEADMNDIAQVFTNLLTNYYKSSGRKIRLEIEPGTWLVANGGYLLSSIVDIVNTGAEGYEFLKLDTGMNDFLRPSMYGAQHAVLVLNDSKEYKEYVVVGHNCESGDIITPVAGNPEELSTRRLKRANIGDRVVVCGAGAYCASMRARGYNSFPDAEEILV